MVKVGIPRALVYYEYYPMWKAFFEYLGAEVVVSGFTNREVVAAGSSQVVAETCLPAKVFCGHVLSLADQCDYMFIPSIRSLQEDSYNCSKFLGLPDMVKAVVPKCPPILEIDVEIPRCKKELFLGIWKLGRHFTQNPLKIGRAVEVALQAYQDYRRLMWEEKLMPPQAIGRLEGSTAEFKPWAEGEVEVALLGHPYSLYDECVNYRLIHRLKKLGARVLTPEMVSEKELEQQVLRLTGRHYWTYEHEVSGAGGYYLEQGVDGIIGAMPFGCGPDSLMMDLIKHEAKKEKIPFMLLSFDEHTAEAGVVTRLEAFVDMVQLRKRAKKKVAI